MVKREKLLKLDLGLDFGSYVAITILAGNFTVCKLAVYV